MSIIEKLGSIDEDPFAKYAIFADNELVVEYCNKLGLVDLPAHLHEMLATFVFYAIVYYSFGPLASIFTSWYPNLDPKLKNGAATHVVSWFNAVILLTMSVPLFFNPKLNTLTSLVPYSGFVCALTTGYFLFDFYITAVWVQSVGVPFLLHASTALFVFIQGNRPFMHNFQPHFLWFELSTLFVNFYWFGVNVPNLVSEKTQTINGVCLILAFFFCRVIPGPINGYRLFSDAVSRDVPNVPKWVVLTVMSCYLLLITLNNIWFFKMISAAYHKLTGTKKIGAGIDSRFAKKVKLDSTDNLPAVSSAGTSLVQEEATKSRRTRSGKRRV